MGVDHYENFPVASWLCPPRLRAGDRRHLRASPAPPTTSPTKARPRAPTRLATCRRIAATSRRCSPAAPASARWRDVFGPLARAIDAHRLPPGAARTTCSMRFAPGRRQDALCRPRRAARLLPPLGRAGRPPAAAPVRDRRRSRVAPLRRDLHAPCNWPTSGRTCGVDTARGRLYVPEADCRRHGVEPADLLAGRDSAAVRALVAELVALGARADAAGRRPGPRRRRAAPAGSCASSSRAACACSNGSTTRRRDASRAARARLARRPRARLARTADARARRRPTRRSRRARVKAERGADARSNTCRRRPPPAARASTTPSCSCRRRAAPRSPPSTRSAAKSTTSPTRSATPASRRPSWPGGAARSPRRFAGAPSHPATRALLPHVGAIRHRGRSICLP